MNLCALLPDVRGLSALHFGAGMRACCTRAVLNAHGAELDCAAARTTHAGIADGSFSAATVRRVEARQSRLRLRRRLLEAACIVAIVIASPWLIDASIRLSTLLDAGIIAAVALRPIVAFWTTLLWRRATRWR